MSNHEYRVIPAPRRSTRIKGARRVEERFARTVEAEMNRMAADGWEFVRSDTLPCERKASWFSRPVTVFETLLVFRRAATEAQATEGRQETAAAMPPPVALPPLTAAAPVPPAPAVAVPPPASRFTPAPAAVKPANDGAPVATPPAPSLTLVEEPPPTKAGPAEDPDASPAGRAHAAE